MAKVYGAEQINKARALYMVGKTYREVSQDTGIPAGQLRKVGAKEHWTEQRNNYRTKAEQKADEKLAEKAAQNTVDMLEPLRQVSTTLVEQILSMIPQTERAADIRAMAGAIKDLVQVIRELNGILTYKEQAELENARERLAIDKERLAINESADTEIKFVIEYETD